MNQISSTISISQGDFAVRALGRLADDLVAALLPQQSIGLDLSGCADGDIRIVQLVEAARRHATEVGADLMLMAPPPGSTSSGCSREPASTAPPKIPSGCKRVSRNDRFNPDRR